MTATISVEILGQPLSLFLAYLSYNPGRIPLLIFLPRFDGALFLQDFYRVSAGIWGG